MGTTTMTDDPFKMDAYERTTRIAAANAPGGLPSEGATKKSLANTYADNDRDRAGDLTRREKDLAAQYDPVEDARITRMEAAYGDRMTPSQRMGAGFQQSVRDAARKAGTFVEPSAAADAAHAAVDDARSARDAVYARPGSTHRERSDAETALYMANSAVVRLTR